MDLSFAVQTMSALYILEHQKCSARPPAKVIDVSAEIDDIIARRRLAAWGIEIDQLTPEQEAYLNSWQVFKETVHQRDGSSDTFDSN